MGIKLGEHLFYVARTEGLGGVEQDLPLERG